MALLPERANTAENKDTLDDRSPIPAGTYVMAITRSEMKQNKAKTGYYLSAMFKVQEGEYKGRTVFVNLNLVNPSAVATEIAKKELNTICQACGLESVADSDELHGIPMAVTLRINENKNSDYPPQNEIVGYGPLNSVEDVPQVAKAERPPQPEKPKNKLPWEK